MKVACRRGLRKRTPEICAEVSISYCIYSQSATYVDGTTCGDTAEVVQLRTGVSMTHLPFPCELANDRFCLFIDVEKVEIVFSDRLVKLDICCAAILPIFCKLTKTLYPFLLGHLVKGLQSFRQHIL